MKKAWDDIKSFMTVAMTLAYIVLTFKGQMTSDFQNIYLMIVAFYFGTQAEKLVNKIKSNESKVQEIEEFDEIPETNGELPTFEDDDDLKEE